MTVFCCGLLGDLFKNCCRGAFCADPGGSSGVPTADDGSAEGGHAGYQCCQSLIHLIHSGIMPLPH
ncbi:hypothetical protein AADR41_10790 [Streptomyces sp. CLV115]|uniref:hypothetical protein n=1 Tax=Streptomyces sp. CLV115 TaxID=3138502 RepID=UPI00313E0282